jgi:hypothetical protein
LIHATALAAIVALASASSWRSPSADKPQRNAAPPVETQRMVYDAKRARILQGSPCSARRAKVRPVFARKNDEGEYMAHQEMRSGMQECIDRCQGDG